MTLTEKILMEAGAEISRGGSHSVHHIDGKPGWLLRRSLRDEDITRQVQTFQSSPHLFPRAEQVSRTEMEVERADLARAERELLRMGEFLQKYQDQLHWPGVFHPRGLDLALYFYDNLEEFKRVALTLWRQRSDVGMAFDRWAGFFEAVQEEFGDGADIHVGNIGYVGDDLKLVDY